MDGTDFLRERVNALRKLGQYRSLPPAREGTDFWSNDYLGFSRLFRPDGEGKTFSTGSRLISGNDPSIGHLEEEIAAFHGFPAALLYGSGYTANLGLLSCLARRTDTIVYDELIHASLRDGIRLSGATARRCKHNDVKHAESVIAASRPDGQTFFVTESRFSMDGDTAPLMELAEVCKRHGAHLIIDEAHATGLEGRLGAGIVDARRLHDQVFASIITYGKAPGFHGACVLGSNELKKYLVNFSRPFIYSTGPRPSQLSGLQQVYDLLRDHHLTAYENLRQVIGVYQQEATSRLTNGAPTNDGPIQQVIIGDNDGVMALESKLLSSGFLVKGIRSPTVAAGTERLRICLHAFNTPTEVRALIRAMDRQLTDLS